MTTTQTEPMTIAPPTTKTDKPMRLVDRVDPADLVQINTDASLMMNPVMFEHMQRVCAVYSESDVVPQQFRGKLANCMIAFELAHRMRVNVFMLMQSMYVVQGKPGLEAKLVIALMNERGPFRGPVQFRMDYDDNRMPCACTAFAIHKQTGEKCECTVTIETVRAEGWLAKSGTKWKTMPEQMFKYRSAAWLARLYCPEVIMGMHTTDELADTYGDTKYVENDAQAQPSGGAANLMARVRSTIPDEPAAEPDRAAGQPVEAQDEPTTEPAAAPQTPAHEPSAVEQLCILYADLHDLAPADAEARLNAEAAKKWGKGLDALKPKALADLRDMVGNGMFAPE